MNFALNMLFPMMALTPAAGPDCCTPPTGTLSTLPHVQQNCPPLGPPAPLLGVRILAPEGVKVAVPGTKAEFAAPTVFGCRPGYSYRFELSKFAKHPGATLYPVVDVLGTLVPRPGMKYMEFPAPIYFTDDDVRKAISGSLVTKVVYLEDPTKAIPMESRPDEPLEFNEAGETESMRAAMNNGRPMMLIRLGDRKPDAEELARSVSPGTLLLPGEQTLSAPREAPRFPFAGIQLYDPIAGPKPLTEECFIDGGDKGNRLGIGSGGKLHGLDPTDTAAEFTTGAKRRTTSSNQVCICSPRYAIRRSELVTSGFRTSACIDAAYQITASRGASTKMAPSSESNHLKPVGVANRTRTSLAVTSNGIASYIGMTAPQGTANTTAGTRVVSSAVEPDEITTYPDELLLAKSVEPTVLGVFGFCVTFTIRYKNNTPKPVTDLHISDSLSGRLEYVSGSTLADRPSNVTTADNEVGSVIVRFEIPGPIPAGQGGLVKFKAKVR